MNAETKAETVTMEPLPSGRESRACHRIQCLRGEVTDALVDTAGAGRLRGTRDYLLGPAGAASVHRRTCGLSHNQRMDARAPRESSRALARPRHRWRRGAR